MQFLRIQKPLCPVARINKTGSRQSTTALSKKRENAVATLILQGENIYQENSGHLARQL